jgi:hypothetical protein
VLHVIVAHSALLEELATFRKPGLLAILRADVPSATISDIRFQVGPVDSQNEFSNMTVLPATAKTGPTVPCYQFAPQRTSPKKKLIGVLSCWLNRYADITSQTTAAWS